MFGFKILSSLGTAEIQISVRANAGKKYLIICSFIPAYAHILRIFYILQWYSILIMFFSILIVYFCIHFSPLWLIIIVRYYPHAFFMVTSRFCRMFLGVSIVMIEYIIYTQYIQFVAVLDDNCFVYLIVAVLIIFLFLLLCTLKNAWT